MENTSNTTNMISYDLSHSYKCVSNKFNSLSGEIVVFMQLFKCRPIESVFNIFCTSDSNVHIVYHKYNNDNCDSCKVTSIIGNRSLMAAQYEALLSYSKTLGFISSSLINESFDSSETFPEVIINNIQTILATGANIPEHAHSLAKQNDCQICFDNIKDRVALVPCGHTSYCTSCAYKIFANSAKCAFCNTVIDFVMKLY